MSKHASNIALMRYNSEAGSDECLKFEVKR